MQELETQNLNETQKAGEAQPTAPTDDALSSAGVAPAEEALSRQRLRLVYEKSETVKFISHQDEYRLWERTLRRADLPLLYKQGFNPQPHLVFASPLGVGITGIHEPIDIILSPPVAIEDVQARIIAKLPPGVYLHSIKELPINAPALQSLLIGADYTILLFTAPGERESAAIDAAIANILAQSEIWRERERKGERYTYNLRPLIFELQNQGYDANKEEHRIFLRVQQRAGATGRPDEVVAALGLDDHARTLRRDKLYYSDIPADVATFAAYPVIEQNAINAPKPPRYAHRKHKPDRTESTPRATSGRSISERAGDEFI